MSVIESDKWKQGQIVTCEKYRNPFFIVALIHLDKSKFIKHKIKVGIGFGLTYDLINVLFWVFET